MVSPINDEFWYFWSLPHLIMLFSFIIRKLFIPLSRDVIYRLRRLILTRDSACTVSTKRPKRPIQTLQMKCTQNQTKLHKKRFCQRFKPGRGNVWPAGHMRPTKHLYVALELCLKFSNKLFWYWKDVKTRKISDLCIVKITLKSYYFGESRIQFLFTSTGLRMPIYL